MEDVAKRAGVSRSLVSLVFQHADNVSEGRRQAVLDAAADLGYRPNRVARQLAQGRSMTIGLVVDDLQNPFFARAVDGIEQQAESAGYQVLIVNGARDIDRGLKAAHTLLDLQVDGLLLVGVRGDHGPVVEIGRQRPTALIAASLPVEAEPGVGSAVVDSVIVDEDLGAWLAIEHLVKAGHRSIVHIDGGSGASAEDRRQGYRKAMDRAGLADQIEIVPADFTHEAGAQAALELASRPDRPTAVFAGNDLIATGLWMQLERLGYEVPGDYSVVGFDDSAVFGVGEAGLTTIRQPSDQMGSRAAELLLDRIDGERDHAVHELIAPTLVERNSTAAPRH